MEMETAGSIAKNSVREADISAAFADDAGRGNFIILSASDSEFIQAVEEGDELFVVEYRDAHGRQFQASMAMVKPVVEAAFRDYLRLGTAWRDKHHWRPLK
jgi:hypothetical protein